MAIVLTIPDEILETLKLPKKQIEEELKKELAFLLCERGLASLGIARKLTEMSKWEFIEGLVLGCINWRYMYSPLHVLCFYS